jgi:hypothetical protein
MEDLSTTECTWLWPVHSLLDKAMKLRIDVQPVVKYSSGGRLGCDTVQCCGRILTFQRSMLFPSSGCSEILLLISGYYDGRDKGQHSFEVRGYVLISVNFFPVKTTEV